MNAQTKTDKGLKANLPTSVREFSIFINGEWVRPAGAETITRSSPAHDVPVATFINGTKTEVSRAVVAARQAFEIGDWSNWSSADRAAVLLRTAQGIRDRSYELALQETLETGKPISQAQDEVDGAAGLFEYAAGQARALHGETYNNLGDSMLGLVTREPIGVVGVITPWNFPFFVLCERIPFILASGCTAVVKPSELTSGTALLLSEILHDAGLPNGVYNVVTGDGASAGQPLIEHPDVDMISFTGSTAIGRRVLEASVKNIKRVGLELGGNNPQVVFADADLDAAADGVAFGFTYHSGQVCVSGSRLLVEHSVAKDFEALLVAKVSKIRVGDPLNPATQVGSMVSDQHYNKVSDLIRSGLSQGARLVCGGIEASPQGRFLSPTIFADVNDDMSVACEEVFGPVLTIQTFDTFEKAVEMANDTRYGLAASVWTRDLEKALIAMRRIKAGRFWINTTITGGPELPIGGFKESGIGRETGKYGVEEYTEIKSTHIQLGRSEPRISG